MSRKSPREEAKRLLAELHITRPPVPVERIARHLGATIRYSPFDGDISGIIHIKDGIPIIGVNSLHPPNRQRFTVAHECAHLIFDTELITNEVHVDKKLAVLRRDDVSATGKEKREIRANQFAADLIMPHAFLLHALGNDMIDIDDSELVTRLAREFKVSTEA